MPSAKPGIAQRSSVVRTTSSNAASAGFTPTGRLCLPCTPSQRAEQLLFGDQDVLAHGGLSCFRVTGLDAMQDGVVVSEARNSLATQVFVDIPEPAIEHQRVGDVGVQRAV